MVETAAALEAVLGVEGLDGTYAATGDLSLSLALDGADRSRDLHDVLSSIISRAFSARVPRSVHAYNGEDAASYAAAGATIVTVAVDSVSLGEA